MAEKSDLQRVATALAVVLIAVTVFVAGCDSNPTDMGDDSVESTATTVLRTDTTDLYFGETGVWDGIEVTVGAPLDDPDAQAPLDDEKIVYCTVTIVNGSGKPLEYDGLEFVFFDSEGELFQDYAEASVPMLGAGSLEPGAKVSAAVAYRVPLEAAPSRVAWQRNLLADPELTWSVR